MKKKNSKTSETNQETNLENPKTVEEDPSTKTNFEEAGKKRTCFFC